jgi:general secretion pathway protein N
MSLRQSTGRAAGRLKRPLERAGSSRWASALGGLLLGAGLGTAIFAPAQWLALALSSLSDERIQLTQTEGSLWHGSARLVLAGGAGSRDAVALPGRVAWQLRPSWRGAQLAVSAPCCTQQDGTVTVSAVWGGADINMVLPNSQWPATLLAGLGTPWNTLALDGTLTAQSRGMDIALREGRATLAGDAQFDLIQASSRLSTLKPIGSYRVLISGGALTGIQLSTLEGALRLSGSGEWVGQRLRFKGEASAAPESEAALGNLLNIIGRRQGARSIMTIG